MWCEPSSPSLVSTNVHMDVCYMLHSRVNLCALEMHSHLKGERTIAIACFCLSVCLFGPVTQSNFSTFQLENCIEGCGPNNFSPPNLTWIFIQIRLLENLIQLYYSNYNSQSTKVWKNEGNRPQLSQSNDIIRSLDRADKSELLNFLFIFFYTIHYLHAQYFLIQSRRVKGTRLSDNVRLTYS